MSAEPTSSMLLMRRFARRQPVGDIALDVLDDDDGVVDDDADRQHQAEQRQVVQREAERRHDGERADERHRHGDQRNDRRAPVLQEQEHDEDDQDDRLDAASATTSLIDSLDELRRVVDDVVFDAGREALRRAPPSSRHAAAAVSSALEPGSWKMASATAGSLIEIASSTRSPARRVRPWRRPSGGPPPPGVCLTTIVPNSLGLGEPARASAP